MGTYDDALLPIDPPPPSVAPPISGAPMGGTYGDALQPPVEPPPEAPGNVVHRSGIFPVSVTDKGKLIWDWGSGITGDIGRAFTLPGRVASGEVPMPQLGTRDPNAYNQIIPEATNFATTFGPINPAIRSGDKIVPGVSTNITRPLREAPPSSQLLDVGGRQMDEFRDLPIKYVPGHIGSLADTIEQRLIDRGVYRDDAKGIYNTLDLMRKSAAPQPPGVTAVITPGSLHSLRQNITNKFGRMDEHQLAPQIALEELDRFIAQPPGGAVVARSPTGQAGFQRAIGTGQNGSPRFDAVAAGQNAGSLFQDALGNMAGGYRGQGIADLQREIDLKTAGAHSGRNLDNTTRQKITSLLLDEKRNRGFTPAEQSTFEGAVYGDPTTNRLRSASKVLGGGGGLGALASSSVGGTLGTLSSAMFGVPPWVGAAVGGAIPPVLGERLGAWGAARTGRAMDAVSEATRRRTPLFESLPPLPPQTPGAAFGASRDAIARSLMLGTMPAPPDRLYVSPNRDEERM